MDTKDIVARALEFAAAKDNIQRDAVAQQQIREFVGKYPYKEKPELLRAMTPDDLFDGSANDRFFNWLEDRTDSVGSVFTHGVGVYPEAVKRFSFFKVILTVLVSDKSVSFKIDQNWGIIPGFGGEKLIAKKLLSLYYSDFIMPVYKTEDLERFSFNLGINYRSKANQHFRKDYTTLTTGQKFELLNIGLLEFKKAHLDGWTNTMFAHFLEQGELPPGTEPEEAAEPVKQPELQPAAPSQRELSKTAQLLEARLKVAVKTIKDLRAKAKSTDERVKNLQDELNARERELKKLESELQQRTQEQQAIKQENEKKASDQEQAENEAQKEMRKRIGQLEDSIRERDERIKSMAEELSQRESFVRIGESDFIEGDIGAFEMPPPPEVELEKVKSGTPRLDDLLNGGVPIGSQMIVYGPSFIGKEIVMDSFAAHGIANGIPLIWVTTDKTIEEIREEMSHYISDFESYEKKGLIYYIDAYSRMVGDNSVVENASYLDDTADVESIVDIVEEQLGKMDPAIREKGYRLVFRSVSSLSANHDIKSIFALLRQFVAKRRKDKCVATYSIEKGIMSEQDLQIISSIMDGVMEFTTDGTNNFLSIQGICETQTRERVEYSVSKGELSIGSFFLGRIK